MAFRRSNVSEAAGRSHLGGARFTVSTSDDLTLLQQLGLKGHFGESMDTIEHMHPYGFTTVNMAGDENGQPEAIGSQMGANRSHVVVHSVSDRRYRPNNLQPGEVAMHDHQSGNMSQQIYLSKDMVVHNSGNKIHMQVNQNMHVVLDKSAKTMTVQFDGQKSSTFILSDSSAKMQSDALSVTISGGKVMLGNGSAPHAVITKDGPSSNVFSTISETDTAPQKMQAASIATRTKAQQGSGTGWFVKWKRRIVK